ncbi:unknown [Clostridium sp. CAG:1219]|nr:unknown [Clostridium sp. CAG:1219]
MATSDSDVERAATHFLISPGVSVSLGVIAVLKLKSSSEILTIAVILEVNSFNPLRTLARPLPPPITTILGPFFNLGSEYNNFLTFIFLFFLEIFLSDIYSIFFCAIIKENSTPKIDNVKSIIYAINIFGSKSYVDSSVTKQYVSTATDTI